MSKINIKSYLSILISKIVIFLSRKLLKGGTNFPGKVALKIDNNILKVVAKDYKIILVTGTNGKTTTTSMIYNVLKDSGKKVITNASGANMLPGIVTCFVENYKFNKDKSSFPKKKYAVIEVDEANVPLVTEYVIPEFITITNIFRDQLDRYGEVYTTLNKILEGIEKVPFSTLVLNGDEALFSEINLPNRKIYYGFKKAINDTKGEDINTDSKLCKKCNHPYTYNFLTYNNLGDFYCENCDSKRPELNYFVNEVIELTSEGSAVVINGTQYYINQPGAYNIYNALSAFSIARELGIEKNIITSSFKNQKSSFGRQEELNIEGKEVKIILVKNPAGCDQAIDTIALDNREINLVTILNDNTGDGKDVSWIWDVNFEKLNSLNISKTIIFGSRLYDMAIRLKIAGLPYNEFSICQDYEGVLSEIISSKGDTFYVLVTYTAMLEFRKFLHNKKYIETLW
ncbi:MurT ligase domain-containing protein [Clostridium cochlearium]|uniref:MurT ligase domain-containing protein n=1 Tax=Clostridium cochlearium TaxID=1494 RepID=UPI001C0E9228|nr:Mur ligase family protein [Clostridium cochlearium]